MEAKSLASITPKELTVMNSGFRKILMKLYEFPIINIMVQQHHINLHNKIILDAGCGNGNSTRLIAHKFKPFRLDAFDVLPEQITQAQKLKVNATFFIGDVTQIQKESELYDVVFIFGILHHVPLWHNAIGEIHRVLKSGGYFLLEEPTQKLLDHAEHHHNLIHPNDARFTYDEMKTALEISGFQIIDGKMKLKGNLMFIIAKKK